MKMTIFRTEGIIFPEECDLESSYSLSMSVFSIESRQSRTEEVNHAVEDPRSRHRR